MYKCTLSRQAQTVKTDKRRLLILLEGGRGLLIRLAAGAAQRKPGRTGVRARRRSASSTMSAQYPVYRNIDVTRLGGMPPFSVEHLVEIDPVVEDF